MGLAPSFFVKLFRASVCKVTVGRVNFNSGSFTPHKSVKCVCSEIKHKSVSPVEQADDRCVIYVDLTSFLLGSHPGNLLHVVSAHGRGDSAPVGTQAGDPGACPFWRWVRQPAVQRPCGAPVQASDEGPVFHGGER